MDTIHPIFIVGTPRSGTTLLSMILNKHSSIRISPETHFFELVKYPITIKSLMKENDKLVTQLTNRSLPTEFKERLWDEIVGPHFNGDEQLLNLLNVQSSGKDFLECLLKEDAARHKKIIWGEKTPGHLFFVPSIKRLFPTAKIVHIIRDPRAVSLSTRKAWPTTRERRAADSIDCFSWEVHTHIGSYYQTLYPSDYCELRYETLLTDPESSIRRLCAFLDVDFEIEMITGPQASPNFNLDIEPWKIKALDPIDPTRATAWTTEMSSEEQRFFEQLLGSKLAKRGFPTTRQDFTVIDRVRERLWKFAWRGFRKWDRWRKAE